MAPNAQCQFIQDTNRHPASLQPSIEGSSGSHLWNSEVPPIPLWPEIHARHRTQTFSGTFQPRERNPYSCSKYPGLMGTYHDYAIEYRKTSAQGNADALSRLLMGEDTHFDRDEAADASTVCTIQMVSQQLNPTDAGLLAEESSKDPVISAVMRVCEGRMAPQY